MCCATCRMFSGTSGFAMPKMHQNSNLAVLWCWQRAWSFSVAVTQAPTSSSSPAFPFSVELVENIYRPWAIIRGVWGGLGVDDAERSVEAREGADKVLHERKFEALA